MKFGYRRSVAGDETWDVQRRTLEAAGCELIFEDFGVSGVNPCKPGLDQLLEALGAGDEMVVWRLDRLARDFTDMLAVLEHALLVGARVISLLDGVGSGRSGSDELFVIVRALLSHRANVETEQSLAVRQRRFEALRGPGRPGSVSDEQWARAKELFEDGETSVAKVAGTIGVSRQALCRRREGEA